MTRCTLIYSRLTLAGIIMTLGPTWMHLAKYSIAQLRQYERLTFLDGIKEASCSQT